MVQRTIAASARLARRVEALREVEQAEIGTAKKLDGDGQLGETCRRKLNVRADADIERWRAGWGCTLRVLTRRFRMRRAHERRHAPRGNGGSTAQRLQQCRDAPRQCILRSQGVVIRHLRHVCHTYW